MNYLIRRILQLIPTFIIATMIAFILFSLVGDPFEGMRQDPRLASQVERLRKIQVPTATGRTLRCLDCFSSL